MSPRKGGGPPGAGRQRQRGEVRSPREAQRKSPAAPRGLGGEQVEGRQAVRELLLAQTRRVREVLVSTGLDENDVVAEIVELCTNRRVPLRYVARARIDQVAKSDAPQGIVAYASELPEVDLEELFESDENLPFLLAFDGVTDPHNLGSVIRSGECAGVTGIILPRHRTVHVTPTVVKASAGAVEHVPMTIVAGLPAALEVCKAAGVWTVGLDMDGDTDIHDLEVADQPVVLVFGAEGEGLSRLTKRRCDVLLRIPQYGKVASLNVAAAGAVACFEVARRRAIGS